MVGGEWKTDKGRGLKLGATLFPLQAGDVYEQAFWQAWRVLYTSILDVDKEVGVHVRAWHSQLFAGAIQNISKG